MNGMTFVLALVGLGALRGVAWMLAGTVNGSSHEVGPSLGEPRSPVRILRNDHELEEAIDRALGYDLDAQNALHRRIHRYRESDNLRSAAVIDLQTRGAVGDTAGADRQTVTA